MHSFYIDHFGKTCKTQTVASVNAIPEVKRETHLMFIFSVVLPLLAYAFVINTHLIFRESWLHCVNIPRIN